MAKIEKFEDIEIWQKARILTNLIYENSENDRFGKNWGLKDQMRRSAVSIMSNIAEGFERNGNKEFSQFLAIAKGSVGELRSQLYITRDQNLIEKETFSNAYSLCTEISKGIAGFMKYLKSSNLKGSKYT